MKTMKTSLLISGCLLILFIEFSVSACPLGDLNSDCTVNLPDLIILTEQWLTPAGCFGYEGNCADLVGSDGVNLEDFSVFSKTWGVAESFPVVINEIHCNPDLSEELVEFVELYNSYNKSIDLSGWRFTNGISYTFPSGTTIAAGGYLVIAEDPTPAYVDVTITGKYGTPANRVLGPFTGNLNNEGETITLSDAQGKTVDQVDYQLGFPWPTVGDAISAPGTGASIQLVNPNFDNDLGGNWRSAYPTPGAANTGVYTANNPPCIRQVNHSPKQPTAGQVVTVTAKVTDPDGVASVTLRYQLNNPGGYIPITLPNLSTTTPTIPNPAYENAANWTSIAMYDNGLDGDAVAGDGVYTVRIPAGIQTHRRLVRYRITAVDTGTRSITVPYADDPQPNFAYFVYNGVPSWTGNGVSYSPEVLTSLPVYHLIARMSDVENCFWNSSWDTGKYHFSGTMIHDGRVYDHVYYHIRGQASTFRWGKNKCRFKFNRGHYFQAKDDYGQPYETLWNSLVLGTGTCPWWQWPHPGTWDKGAGGMMLNEPLSYRLYNLAGVPSPNTHFFHFRVIDEAAETGATQYIGDFWGLYFAIEDPDGRFLKEHGLPDGNVYKMENGYADQKNQGPTQVTDDSDVWAFINGQNASSTQTWWQTNVDLDRYYSFKTVGIVINNSDPRPQENCFYYRNPITHQWSIHPWDLDLTYEWATHYTWWENITHCLNYPALNIAYKNRARELADLLFDNNHYGWRQTDQLVDEMASVIAASYNGQRFVDAERAMWDNHPRVSSIYKNLWYEHNEFFTQPGRAKNWDNMVAYYKQFLTATGMSGFLSGSYGLHALLPSIADAAIPNRPTISYIGQPGYPLNNLLFQTSAFSDPQGAGTFAAIQWRIGRVENPAAAGYTVRQRHPYEVEALWQSPEITNPSQTTIQIPAAGLQVGKLYRVRSRMKDNTGRWSHWSNPIQFTAGTPLSGGILEHLRITEVMYHPAPADPAKGELNVDKNEFEFIELKNRSANETLNLTSAAFTRGITFSFAGSAVTSLAPGEFVLVVRNTAAFNSRYPGLSGRIAGVYSGRLDNDGEQVTLVDTINGTIADFEYNDGYGWPVSADGSGHSLVPLESALPGQPNGSLNYGGNWRASTYLRGSPGADDPAPVAGIVINELMAHTDYSDPSYPEYDSNDWIELYNPTGSTIAYDGHWYLSDSPATLKKWALPVGSIPAGGRVSFDEVTGFHNPITAGFGLDKTGEYVLLSYLPGTSADRVVDSIRFSGQYNNISFGRYPDGGAYWFFLAAPGTRDTANAGPLQKSVVISEIMYHPSASTNNDEYIELYNPTGSAVALFNAAGTWRLDNAVSFTFPAGRSIPGGGKIVVVGFDPAVETTRLAAFNTAYGSALTAGTTIFGPWTGDLSNSSERIALQEPQQPDPPQALTTWWINMDQVIYGDWDPWPISPDGYGNALVRISSSAWASGDDPSNWTADSPTPGR